MKISFNKLIKGIDGIDIPNANAGKVLANTLVGQPKGDAVKFYGWALKLHEGKELDIDKSDHETLKNFVKECEVMTILVKAQLLENIGEFKEE